MRRVLWLFLVGAAFAQTPANSWNGIEEVQTISMCALHGADSVLCIGTDGMKYSYQGAAFVTIGGQSVPPTFTATATSLPAGSQATVTLTGDSFTFGIPAGAQGPQGNPGTPGVGGVASVNGTKPDSTGNVSIHVPTAATTTLN